MTIRIDPHPIPQQPDLETLEMKGKLSIRLHVSVEVLGTWRTMTSKSWPIDESKFCRLVVHSPPSWPTADKWDLAVIDWCQTGFVFLFIEGVFSFTPPGGTWSSSSRVLSLPQLTVVYEEVKRESSEMIRDEVWREHERIKWEDRERETRESNESFVWMMNWLGKFPLWPKLCTVERAAADLV